MKPYLISLALGLAAGVLYGVFNVRSPAPPIIALLGLLGILMGEQIPHFIRQAAEGRRIDSAWIDGRIERVLGTAPMQPLSHPPLASAKTDKSA